MLSFAIYARTVNEAIKETDERIVNLLLGCIYKPIGLRMKNGENFYIDKTVASRFLNADPKRPIHNEIVSSSGVPKVIDSAVDYFSENVCKKVIPAMQADMIDNLTKLINFDETISKTKKNELLSLANEKTLANFLASTFLYVVNKPNKSYKDDNKQISSQNEQIIFISDPLMGRKEDLEKLDKIIHKHGAAVISANMGYGKTVLVNLYAGQFRKCKFEVIDSMNAVKIMDKLPNLKSLIKEPTDYNNINLGKAISIELKTFYNNHDIIIFDNLCDVRNDSASKSALDMLQYFFDEFSQNKNNEFSFKIIITTREKKISAFPSDCHIDLDELDYQYSADILRKASKDHAYDFNEVLDKYGRVPIIIDDIKNNLIAGGEPKNIYLKDVNKDNVKENLVSLTQNFFDIISKDSAEEIQIYIDMVKTASFLSGDEISQELLVDIVKEKYSGAGDKIDEVNRILSSYSILRKIGDGRKYTIHGGYQEAIRHITNGNESDGWIVEKISSYIRHKLILFSYYGFNEWNLMNSYYSHINALSENHDKDKICDLFLHLVWYSGYILGEREKILEERYGTIFNLPNTDLFIKGLAHCDKILLTREKTRKSFNSKSSLGMEFESYYTEQFEEINEILNNYQDKNDIKYQVLKIRSALVGVEFCFYYDYNGRRKALEICGKILEEYPELKFDAEGSKELKDLYVFLTEHKVMILNDYGKLLRQKTNYDSALGKHVEALKILMNDCRFDEELMKKCDYDTECYKECDKKNITDNQKCDYANNNANSHCRAKRRRNECDYNSIAFTQNLIGVYYHEHFSGACVQVSAAIDYFVETYKIYEKLNYNYGMYNQIENIGMACRKIARYLISNQNKISDEEKINLKEKFLDRTKIPILSRLESFPDKEYIPTNFHKPNIIANLTEDFIYLAKSCFKYVLWEKQKSEISSESAQKLYRYLSEVELARGQIVGKEDKYSVYSEAENYADEGIKVNKDFKLGNERSKLHRMKGIVMRNRLYEFPEKSINYGYADIEKIFKIAVDECGNNGEYSYGDYQFARIELLMAYFNNRKNDAEDYAKFKDLQIAISNDLIAKVENERNTTDDFAPIVAHLRGKMRYVEQSDVSEEYTKLLEVYKIV